MRSFIVFKLSGSVSPRLLPKQPAMKRSSPIHPSPHRPPRKAKTRANSRLIQHFLNFPNTYTNQLESSSPESSQSQSLNSPLTSATTSSTSLPQDPSPSPSPSPNLSILSSSSSPSSSPPPPSPSTPSSSSSSSSPVSSYQYENSPVFSEEKTLPLAAEYSNDINPYNYLLDFYENANHTITFLTNVSQHFHSVVKSRYKLQDTFTFGNSTAILNHYYLSYDLPTWYPPMKERKTEMIQLPAYAQAIGYESKQVMPTTKTTITRINAATPNLMPELYLGETATKEQADKDADQTTPKELPLDDSDDDEDEENSASTFNETKFIQRKALFMQPWYINDSITSTTVINGIKIECTEISGFHVPQPNPLLPPHKENSEFLNSAVQAAKIVPPFNITPTNPYAKKTPPTVHPRQTIRHVLGEPTKHRLPYFSANVLAHHSSTRLLNGFTPSERLNLATEHSDTYTADNMDVNAKIPSRWKDKHFYAWSSYRFLKDIVTPNDCPMQDRVFFLLNMRTIYGTNVDLVKLPDPIELIPRPNDA